MKQLLIFDAYGTLISTGSGSLDAVNKILSLQDKIIDARQFYSEWKKLHRLHIDQSNERIFLTESEIFEKDLERLYQMYSITRPHKEDVTIMHDSLLGRKVFSDTVCAINSLRRKYRVVIGSTTDTEPLLSNLKANLLEVDAVYTSEMLRCYKPAEKFYRSILESENISADNVVFIGDSLIDDVAGPQKVGIRTVLLDRNKKCTLAESEIIPDCIVSSLSDIAAIL